MAQYYDYKNKKSYKELNYKCQKCKWCGTGEQCVEGFDSSTGFSLDCPNCEDMIEWIDITVSLDELIQYGSSEDKADALKQKQFFKRVSASRSRLEARLPEINSDEIIFTLREEEYANGWRIVLYLRNKQGKQKIHNEPRAFEYYNRYLEIGELLKKKYGDKLVDFEVAETVDLGGDSFSAFGKVRAFRKSLSGKENMGDNKFGFITKSGQFDKKAMYWKAVKFAEKFHSAPCLSRIESVIKILLGHNHVSDYIFTIAVLYCVLEDTSATKEDIYEFMRKRPDNKTISRFAYLYSLDNEGGAEMYDRLNNGDVRDAIAEADLLIYREGDSHKKYVNRIFRNNSIKRENYYYNGAVPVMLADRLHNLILLRERGRPDNINMYIEQTEELFMPWQREHSEYKNLFAAIEKQLESLKNVI